MVRLSKFLWRIGFVSGEFISHGTCASVKPAVPLLTSNPIRLEEARPRKRPGFLRTDDRRGLTRRGQKELSARLRIQFRPQPLRQLLDLFQFLDGVFRQRASMDIGYIGWDGLGGASQVVGMPLQVLGIDAALQLGLVRSRLPMIWVQGGGRRGHSRSI